MNPNLRLEKQHTLPKQGNLERPRIGQGRARSKRKKLDPINHVINRPSNLSQEIPERTKIETRKTNSMHTTNNAVNNNPFIPDVPFHLDLLLRPKQPIRQNITCKQNSQNEQNISLTLIIISRKLTISRRCHVRDILKTGQVILSKPKELGDLINKESFVHKYLPKQTDIDKILEVIQRKVLRGHTSAYGN